MPPTERTSPIRNSRLPRWTRHAAAATAFLLATGLFFAFFLRALLLAYTKIVGADEETGIGEALDNGYFAIARGALNEEASPSPLQYLLDKLWIAAWGGNPHFAWNLRIFFRIIPAGFWSAACVAVFLFCFRHGRRSLALPAPVALAVGAVAAWALNSIDMLLYYGAEDRPYASWLFFSVVQLLLFLRLYLVPYRRRDWLLYGAATIGLPFAAHPGIAQAVLTTAVRWLVPGDRNRPDARRELGILAAALFTAFWFIAHGTHGIQNDNVFSTYLAFLASAAHQVLFYPFHFYGGAGHPLGWSALDAYSRAAILLVLLHPLPFLFRAEPPLVRVLTLLSLGMCGASLAAYLGCVWALEPFEPRYILFCYPFFFCLELLAVYRAGRLLAMLPGIRAWPILRHAGTLLAAGAVLQLFGELYQEEVARFWASGGGTDRAQRENIYSRKARAGCPEELGRYRHGAKNSLDTEKINELCR